MDEPLQQQRHLMSAINWLGVGLLFVPVAGVLFAIGLARDDDRWVFAGFGVLASLLMAVVVLFAIALINYRSAI